MTFDFDFSGFTLDLRLRIGNILFVAELALICCLLKFL